MVIGADDPSEIVTTVIVPCLDEETTIAEVLDRLLKLQIPLQIIVVNDGSTDGTADALLAYVPAIQLISNQVPTGKGNAIKAALKLSTGKVVVIQDADLEYWPEELIKVVTPILSDKADIVLGSRFQNGYPSGMAIPNKIVNMLLVWTVRLLFGKKISDEATCYKAIKLSALQKMNLQCTRFEFCPEIISKSIKLNLRLMEVPIHYDPRSKNAGKKIRWTDAPEAFWTLLRYRFWRP